MPYKMISYQKEGNISIVTLNRPDRLNAINPALLTELVQAIDEMEHDQDVRVSIITGGDKCFSAGVDLKEARPAEFVTALRTALNKIECSAMPFIAAIAGYALGGGCELALACDLRIAADTARIGLPEIKVATLPGAGGTQRLPRLIGPAKAKELLFIGDPVDAEEALRIGLVNRMVPLPRLMEETKALARVLAERAPLSLKMAKIAVNTGIKIDLESGLDLEQRCLEYLRTTEDREEGIKAFGEKRKPVFKGR